MTAVQDGWNTDAPQPIRRATAGELRARNLAGGSMGPQGRSGARFTEQTGRAAAIGALDEAALLLDGVHATTVSNGGRVTRRAQPRP